MVPEPQQPLPLHGGCSIPWRCILRAIRLHSHGGCCGDSPWLFSWRLVVGGAPPASSRAVAQITALGTGVCPCQEWRASRPPATVSPLGHSSKAKTKLKQVRAAQRYSAFGVEI